ncbi:hypothetical protein SAMN04515649_1163 [Eubacterium callanderi]|uniref:Uncharacterized protein n=1 Tax=Eubacterium callanderi TaxID=53442 RepID=A0AB74F4Q3_9FIRM|nr:hypothetical protein [Eubacterium callanderi]PWW59840.1 hypothetical protein C7955_101239 [Eubacterium limosum]DAJ98639.1 MAG TPA: hypothetical protein [Caudoviricetes sp.]MBV1682728.1 hypothetical protein [Eubacterium callanderi]SFP09044.1 hypothetical protein SAMN04487888_1072 [Eubacterium callanderi]SHM36981.1 hypothetical protein SAMN04515649_1163 [Eubacterium callanderi]
MEMWYNRKRNRDTGNGPPQYNMRVDRYSVEGLAVFSIFNELQNEPDQD